MPKREQDHYRVHIQGEPEEVYNIRMDILDTFNELEFIDEGHKYFVGGVELSSVSAFAHRFEEEFNTVEIATAYAKKYGETPEYWMDTWQFKNLRATTTGTQVHSYAESMAWLTAGHPENITADNKYKYIADKNWLIPTRPKEEAALKFWTEWFPNKNLHIVLPETKVYTCPKKSSQKYNFNYAGTFDLLCYYKDPVDDSKSGLVIFDWKTNKELENEYSREHGKMMYAPFNDLYAEAKGTYTIQLSSYQVPLEDIGYKVLGRRIVWLKDDTTYETVKLDGVTDRIRKVLNSNNL